MLWVLGFVQSFCGLFVWLEFDTMIPRSGSEKVYLEAVYKKPKFLPTVIFATNAILLGFTEAGCIVSSCQPPSTKRKLDIVCRSLPASKHFPTDIFFFLRLCTSTHPFKAFLSQQACQQVAGLNVELSWEVISINFRLILYL